MLFIGERSIQGNTQIGRILGIFKFFAFPGHIQLSVGLSVVEMKSAQLCFAWIGFKMVFIIALAEFFEGSC